MNTGNADTKLLRDRGRFLIFAVVFALIAVTLVWRYGETMLSNQENNIDRANWSERGPILDRNGRILAIQTRLGNITIWKPALNDITASAELLAPIISMDALELKERITSSKSDFLYAAKRVDQTSLNLVESARSKGLLPGIGVEPIQGRIYPNKRLASTLVGFVGDDNIGLAGMEFSFEKVLAADGNLANAGYGDQVFLTIDINIQHMLEEIARRCLEENKAESLMFLAMDNASGDILGYVSLPDYDPNDIRSSREQDRIDRPASWAYEPGSVFKVFSLASIMELGGIDADSSFICDGQYEKELSSGERITIKCLGSHGRVTAKDIITYSCNAGAAYASDSVDNASFNSMLRAFGFGEKTGVPLPLETAGYIRPVERWSGRSKQTIAIGQELSVSALQMLQAASAIANDGVLVKPRLVSRVVGPDGVVKWNGDSTATRTVSVEVARQMRTFMETVVSEIGTGRRAGVEDLRLAVKTGTAQLIDPETKRYSDTDFIASCLALVPAERPSLILYIVIVKPKGSSYLGGRIAAPPIGEAAETLADYLGIERGLTETLSHSGTIVLEAEALADIGTVMPDLSGFSKRRLLPLLLREDLTVELHGEGWVRRQEPPPGTPVEPGALIILELE